MHSARPAPALSPELLDAQATLVRAVRRICPPWLADHRDDLAQLAFERVLKRHRTGQVDLQRAYLYRVVHSVVVDELRRRQRRPESPLNPDGTDGPGEPASTAPSADPERTTASAGTRAAILDCLDALVDNRRRAVVLHLQGHTGAEIAALLEWSSKKAENYVYRALADLRACLDAKGYSPSS